MSSANVLDDSGEQYEYVPPMVSPISDSPMNPDSVHMCTPSCATVKTVTEYPEVHYGPEA